MATLDRSIFRQRALDRYMLRQEGHVVLRLVSPRVFLSLWLLLLLAVGAGALVWSVQEPVVISGRGLVVQAKVMDEKSTDGIVVLLLFSPDQQASLHAGLPVSITIATTKITFHSTVQTVEAGVMSPAEIGAQIHSQLPLVMTIAGPAVVAVAQVEPMALAQTYLGSQCQVEVQIGTRSALSLLPGYGPAVQFFHALRAWIGNIRKSIGGVFFDGDRKGNFAAHA
ncbi:MAG TPA: hypothetical protein VF458_21375 [Ktedonobacteraceae bacterium]